MNSQNGTNDIYTNLPSLDAIKAGNITNINYINGKDSFKNESIVVRMKMGNEKPKHSTLVLQDYIVNGILNQTQLILDSVNLKEQFRKEKESRSSIINEEGRIDGLSVKIKGDKLSFVLALVNGNQKKSQQEQ